MAQFLFWLCKFDQYIGRMPGGKFIIFINNCSAHRSSATLPDTKNVEIFFLHPNGTSSMQSLDAGMIAQVKNKYRRRLMLQIFENIDTGRKSIYNVDVLTAILWISEE